MAETSRDERTQRATAKRRTDEKRKGNVPMSREVQSLVTLVCVVGVIWALGGVVIGGLKEIMDFTFRSMASREFSLATVTRVMGRVGMLTTIVVGPLLGTALISGVIASVGQTGWIVSDHKLGFKLTKLNPIGGLKKLFSLNSLVELLKTLPKVALVTYVVVRAIQEELDHMMLSGILQPVDFIPFFGRAAWHVVARALAVFTVIAVIDFALQKYMWERNNRMTKQEVKDERKQMEGDPKIKSRIRALQREAARKRMMGDVPLADVVVTNPTHFAVAIRWNEAEMRAPKVLAKGRGIVALRIREIAEGAGVPRVENPPLARALYKEVDVGMEIPATLYRAVAEILAYVYRRRSRRSAKRVEAVSHG
ncbi:MAG: flagellar biosynthesis protein FlhB [Myxococcales bacterium]|nr:flagellar biosynthesis protein FlhB [Myxococcales bacterium]